MSLVFIKITINAYSAVKKYSFYKSRQIFKHFQFFQAWFSLINKFVTRYIYIFD